MCPSARVTSAAQTRSTATANLVLRGLQGGQLKPVIARTFPLEQIADAHRYLESNQQIGKVVVTV